MSENNAAPAPEQEFTLVDDSIKADDAGFSSNAGDNIKIPTSATSTPESTEELKDQVEQAIENGASKQEVNQMLKEFKLKVNGKEVLKSIDLSDENAVKRELQLAAAAQPAMQRAKELEKAYERELERLMKNPWEVLQELGLNPEELSTKFLEGKVEEMKKSPEQVEKEKLEQEVKKYREQMKQMQTESENARLQQLQEQEAVVLEKEIMEALDNHKSLPKSQRTVSRIADAMLWAIENGFENVGVADVLPAVEADLRSEIGTFIEELPDDMFEEWVGKKKLETYRKGRLSNASKPKAPVNTDVTQTTQSVKKQIEEKKNVQKKKMRDYFDSL